MDKCSAQTQLQTPQKSKERQLPSSSAPPPSHSTIHHPVAHSHHTHPMHSSPAIPGEDIQHPKSVEGVDSKVMTRDTKDDKNRDGQGGSVEEVGNMI